MWLSKNSAYGIENLFFDVLRTCFFINNTPATLKERKMDFIGFILVDFGNRCTMLSTIHFFGEVCALLILII